MVHSARVTCCLVPLPYQCSHASTVLPDVWDFSQILKLSAWRQSQVCHSWNVLIWLRTEGVNGCCLGWFSPGDKQEAAWMNNVHTRNKLWFLMSPWLLFKANINLHKTDAKYNFVQSIFCPTWHIFCLLHCVHCTRLSLSAATFGFRGTISKFEKYCGGNDWSEATTWSRNTRVPRIFTSWLLLEPRWRGFPHHIELMAVRLHEICKGTKLSQYLTPKQGRVEVQSEVTSTWTDWVTSPATLWG